MDTIWYIVCGLLVFVGGMGFQHAFRWFEPRQTITVRQYRDSEVGAAQYKLAQIAEHGVNVSTTLARVEGGVRSAVTRLDDVDLLAAGLVDAISEVSRALSKIFERLQTIEEQTRPKPEAEQG